MEENKDCSLLVIIMDTNPSQRFIRGNPAALTSTVESIIAFANAHLMQKSINSLAMIGVHHHMTNFLFPTSNKEQMEIRQIDGQYEMFTLIEKTVKQKLTEMIQAAPKISQPVESMLAGAIGMALCYIHRIQKNKPVGTKINPRILIVTGSAECASQYMTYMNVFFTAQKENVVLDVCALDYNQGLLHQGADITGGQHLKVPQLDGLLEYLLWVFLPDPSTRDKLVLPPATKIDYRAACFCHRELVDIGYVCSVCLSIFCKFSPICTTCHTVFKTPAPMGGKPKKKKLKT